MKLGVKFILVVLLFAAISAIFNVSRKGYDNGFLSMKNVEALADGESGWDQCVEVRGYCKNSIDGTVFTTLLNIRE